MDVLTVTQVTVVLDVAPKNSFTDVRTCPL